MKIDNVKAIIWDLDGTLIDSFDVFCRIVGEIAAEHGFTLLSDEELIKNYHGSLEESVKIALNIDSAEDLIKAVDVFLVKQNVHYAKDVNANLFNDALKLAQSAARQGLPQLLVTNRAHVGRDHASPRAIVEASALAECITEVRAADEVEFRKPDKRAAEDWLTKHNVHPDEVLVIGDQFVDAQLAVNLQARALLIDRNDGVPHIEQLGDAIGTRIILVKNLHDIVLS